MNRDEVDAFLAEADDVIDDWEGSVDAATWSGDGSHETEISGDYYGDDYREDLSWWTHDPATCPDCRLFTTVPPAIEQWQRGVIDRIWRRVMERVWSDTWHDLVGGYVPVFTPNEVGRGYSTNYVVIYDEARQFTAPPGMSITLGRSESSPWPEAVDLSRVLGVYVADRPDPAADIRAAMAMVDAAQPAAASVDRVVADDLRGRRAQQSTYGPRPT